MTPIPPDDPFVGIWTLDPDESDYQFGEPPASGTYTLEADGDAYNVTMIWTTVDGKPMEASYSSVPDGMEYPYDSPAVDTVSMTRVDAYTLDSASKKDGQVIAYARRELSDDRQSMTITQSGTTPEGDPFANVSVYRKSD